MLVLADRRAVAQSLWHLLSVANTDVSALSKHGGRGPDCLCEASTLPPPINDADISTVGASVEHMEI